MTLKRSNFVVVLLLSLLFLVQFPVDAQQSILSEADELIETGLYVEAINLLEPLVEEKHPEAIFLTGFSMMSREVNMQEAIEMLQRATELYPLQDDSKNDDETLEAHFFLAQAYRLNEETGRARDKFQRLKEFTSDAEILEEIDQEIQFCNNFDQLKKEPVEMEIEHLGKNLNSPHYDHSPVILHDESTVYFTSNRPLESQDADGPYFENIFESQWRNGQWTEPEVLDIPGDPLAHRATVGLTPDGQGLVFFQNDGQNGSLFITRRTFDGWKDPEPLPAPINSNHHESHASFSNNGNTIYFSSDRPGGMGGKDIYISHKLPDGSWGEPLNAGENINTPHDEEGPFIHADNETLYFSSDGHNSMGGYDIFKSEKDENGEWGPAQNMGYPINTASDDLFFMPTPNNQRVYYATHRENNMGRTDLYLLRFPETDERSMSVVSSHIYDHEEDPAEKAVIRITDKASNEPLGTYRINPSSGKFVAIVPAAKEYELIIECEKHKPHKQSFNLKNTDDYKTKERAVYLPPVILEKVREDEKDK
ncbi:MAG: hypothetical protein R6U46_00300 [Marinilabilia sp.]